MGSDSWYLVRQPIQEVIGLLKPVDGSAPILDFNDVSDGKDMKARLLDQLNKVFQRLSCISALDTAETTEDMVSFTGPLLSKAVLSGDVWKTVVSKDRHNLYRAGILREINGTDAGKKDSSDVVTFKPTDATNLEANGQSFTFNHEKLAWTVSSILALQQRAKLWVVSITGRYAIISHWGYSEAIFSDSFDYLKTNWLVEFLWRLGHASLADRGFNDSIEKANKKEARMFDHAVDRYLLNPRHCVDNGLRTNMKTTLDTTSTRHRLRLLDPSDHRTYTYITGRPFSRDPSPFGRSWHAYMALRTSGKKMVILKDTWRSNFPMWVEADAAKTLASFAHSPTAATLPSAEASDSGDISAQGSEAECTTSGECKSGCARHRVVQEVAIHLSMLAPKEFVQLTRNILDAVREIWDDKRPIDRELREIFHQEICSGYLLSGRAQQIVVNNWDNSKEVPLPSWQLRLYKRDRAWRYRSVALLFNETKSPAAEHIVESCFWMFLSVAAGWHAQTPCEMYMFDEVFQQTSRGPLWREVNAGGRYKHKYLSWGTYRHRKFPCKRLGEVVNNFGDCFWPLKLAEGQQDKPADKVKAAREAINEILPIIKFFDDALLCDDWLDTKASDGQEDSGSDSEKEEPKHVVISPNTVASGKRQREVTGDTGASRRKRARVNESAPTRRSARIRSLHSPHPTRRITRSQTSKARRET